MGRRRWKQYQDTLYSGTRSSESVTAQPHHRLYPAFSSSCDPVVPGNLEQIGSRPLHPASSSLPTTITTTTTVPPVITTTTAATTATTTGPIKQESLQRHHLQNHHHLQSSAVQDHHRHYQQQQQQQQQRQQRQQEDRRLRPDEIKVEVGEDEFANGVAREESATKTADTSTTTTVTTGTTTTSTTTTGTSILATSTATGTIATITTPNTTAVMTTGTTTIATRRRRKRRQNDGEATDDREDDEENEEEEDGRGQAEAEKRLKLDEDADRPVSPLRRENDRGSRDYPTANATDTEGTKVRCRILSFSFLGGRGRVKQSKKERIITCNGVCYRNERKKSRWSGHRWRRVHWEWKRRRSCKECRVLEAVQRYWRHRRRIRMRSGQGCRAGRLKQPLETRYRRFLLEADAPAHRQKTGSR